MTTTPSTLAAELHRLTAAELSLPSRLRYVALLLFASTMTALAGALWLTEPALPRRTAVAFAGMVVIGLGWMSFAAWVLTHKRILLAGHRIVAGRLSVSACAAFAAGSLAVGLSTGRPAAWAATGLGVFMLIVAIVLLRRAQNAFARLQDRRKALERELHQR